MIRPALLVVSLSALVLAAPGLANAAPPANGSTFYADQTITVSQEQGGHLLFSTTCYVTVEGPGGPYDSRRTAPPGSGCGTVTVTLSPPVQPGTYTWRWGRYYSGTAGGGDGGTGSFSVVGRASDTTPPTAPGRLR